MESIECFRTKTNRNGNSFQIRINHNRRIIEKGYFIFKASASDTVMTKKQIMRIYDTYTKGNGYKAV